MKGQHEAALRFEEQPRRHGKAQAKHRPRIRPEADRLLGLAYPAVPRRGPRPGGTRDMGVARGASQPNRTAFDLRQRPLEPGGGAGRDSTSDWLRKIPMRTAGPSVEEAVPLRR